MLVLLILASLDGDCPRDIVLVFIDGKDNGIGSSFDGHSFLMMRLIKSDVDGESVLYIGGDVGEVVS